VRSYTVMAGDTLRSIAQGQYGSASLWWKIADANGLLGDSGLQVGQVLSVPIQAGGASNGAGDFRVYDASSIVGDTSPNMPAPPPKKNGCGFLGKLLMIVVAVIVTGFTAGTGSTFWGTVSNGLSNIAAGTAGIGTTITASIAGNVASQMVGLATGTIDVFSWKSVALAGISGGLSKFVPSTVFGLEAGSMANTVARAMVSNAISQGIGVVTGLQEKFSWTGVAAAGVGAGVGQAVSKALAGGFVEVNDPTGMANTVTVPANPVFGGLGQSGEAFMRGALSGLAGGTAAALARGGRVSMNQIATDAFGNALGNYMADEMGSSGSQQEEKVQGVGPNSAADYRNGMDIDSDNYRPPSPIEAPPVAGTGLRLPSGSGAPSLRLTPSTVQAFDEGIWQARSDRIERDAWERDNLTAHARSAVYLPDQEDGLFISVKNAAGNHAPSDRAAGGQGLKRLDGALEGLAKWPQDVARRWDEVILDAAGQGKDGLGRLLTVTRTISNASAEAIGGLAGMLRLGTSAEVREGFVAGAMAFAEDPWGAVSGAYDRWSAKQWHEQLEDVYKLAQTGVAGFGVTSKLKGLISVNMLDDVAKLGGNTAKVVAEYQAAYDAAAAAFDLDYKTGAAVPPKGLNFQTWKGGEIDRIARGRMEAFQQLNGIDDLMVNKRLYTLGGEKQYRIPDLMLPNERTVIDGTIGAKSLSTPQIQDFFVSGKVDRVILVSPKQQPIIITYEQFLKSKTAP
jgi:hypothetical protein